MYDELLGAIPSKDDSTEFGVPNMVGEALPGRVLVAISPTTWEWQDPCVVLGED